MRKPYECDHGRTTLVRRPIGPNHINYCLQCDNCGRRVGNWLKKDGIDQPDRLPQWDYDLEPAFDVQEKAYRLEYAKRNVEARGVVAFAKVDEQHGELFWSAYTDYLNSEQWLQKRHAVLIRARGICQGCGMAKATQVHHLTYSRVGREMLFDLVAVCDACHETIHDKR